MTIEQIHPSRAELRRPLAGGMREGRGRLAPHREAGESHLEAKTNPVYRLFLDMPGFAIE